ncbi:hypothetical protein [Nesterenkonia alkaliphila]|uniref:hypothetical protein n=1 Tax=Nesterenkonia alkaliphila TaxID=1463631 RepID=UPI0012F776EB|nr:hypothetical protein [Nesterenkonia alkaliphila]GFZ82330.1 hypothetical protein GCM10011359_08820 [Nesterenkonia alkaliphila]
MSKIPTKHNITFKCGHTEKVDLGPGGRWPKPANKRKSFALWASSEDGFANPEKGMDCSNCWGEARKQDDTQWLLDIEQFEQKYQLPEFTGTEKQLASEGLVKSAMKSRHSVLRELFEEPTEEAKAQHGQLLEAARTVTHMNFWTDDDGRHGGLGYGVRKDNDYGQEEYIELLLAKYQEELDRAANQEGTERIETENPHDWDGTDEDDPYATGH